MSSQSDLIEPDAETPFYVGAITTGVIALLPYVNVFILPAYLIGAGAAVWCATRRRKFLAFKEGAKLGFLSTLLGSMVAAVVVDLIWVFSDYQLWQHENAQLLLAICRRFAGPVMVDTMSSALAEQGAKPFQWYTLLAQLVGNAVLCGIFGTLSGLLSTKIFANRPTR